MPSRPPPEYLAYTVADCGNQEGHMSLADFRRLCVEYGEARIRYQRSDTPLDYRKEWREICDMLYNKIVEEERRLEAQLATSAPRKT